MNSHPSGLSSIKQAARPTLTMAIWMSLVEIPTIAGVRQLRLRAIRFVQMEHSIFKILVPDITGTIVQDPDVSALFQS
jgi:hypothetical protein